MKDPDNTLPNWFNGKILEDGDNIINPNTGKSILLDKYELSMYDLILGINYTGDHRGWNNEMIELVKKCHDWFKETNPKAFEILLKSEAIIINKALERNKS